VQIAVGEEVYQDHYVGQTPSEARSQVRVAQQHVDQCCPNLGLRRVGRGAHEGLDLWSLLDRDVLNCLGGEDKPGRKLLLAVQEVRLIIEPAAAARRGPCGRGRPDSFDGWFENNLPNHAATARATEEGDAEKSRDAMEQGLRFNRSELYRCKAAAGRPNGRPGGFLSLRKR